MKQQPIPVAVRSGAISRSRYEKSERAFRTISEVAADLDVAQHVLRFWESKFSQVRPIQRGGGRRYYRPEDVDLLRRIRSLLYEHGYTIKGVQRLLKDSGARSPERLAGTLGTPEDHSTLLAEAVPPETARKLDSAERLKVENVLSDLQDALDLLRRTLRPQ